MFRKFAPVSFLRLTMLGISVSGAFSACSGGTSSPVGSTPEPVPIPSVSPSPAPVGPVSLLFFQTGASSAVAGPVDFSIAGVSGAVTIVASEPNYRGQFALSTSIGCPQLTVLYPPDTDANGQADVYLSANANVIPASADCTLDATDPFGHAAVPLLLEYTGLSGGIDTHARRS